mgnify:CR=1 FL=1
MLPSKIVLTFLRRAIVYKEKKERADELLRQLTVSSPELDHLVDIAQDAGALGAKLSGGGRGGNMIALVDDDNEARVKEALLNAGATRVFTTTLEKTL